jgi:hypothetical protein
MSKKQSKK